MAKTHPHIETPTADDLMRVIGDRPLTDVYLALHALVIATLPTIRHSVDEVDAVIGYGAHEYGYGGWGMAAVSPFTKWVSLTLMKGAELTDPDGLLTGTASMRHVKLSSVDELADKRDGIAALLLSATRVQA
ncbi:MAG: DUF1801 domain-containing protein [Microbacterium gubbeenense]|uniref:DUF1801 domain-containing protein n=2 Tax=Microbacterium gubbeenense TaxID=159896 RepID=UPI000406242F|nr:DUF1801 domain-containing protein [Microbacterium gubbeenense]